MKKTIILLLTIFLLFSCSKIERIEPIINNNSDLKEEIKKDKIIDFDNKGWVDLNDNKNIDLEEKELITQRFDVLAKQYNTHSDLMKSAQYKIFVEYVHEVFNKYNDIWGIAAENKNNYIFKVLIPKIVFKNYVDNWLLTEEDAELIIQSIKRNDLNTLEDKKLITEKFKIYFEENKYNPFIKNLNTSNLTKEEKLDLIFKEKDWVIYQVLSNRYNWNKTGIWFKPNSMEADFMDYLNKKLGNTFWVIWVSDEEVVEYAYSQYKVETLEGLAETILNDYKTIVSDYNLEWKIPLKRTYRNDERNNIFVDRATVNKYLDTLSNSDNKKFISDLEKLRFKMYLLSYFGRDRKDLDEKQWLWNSKARSDFIDETYWDWIQNLFRVTRYLPDEKVKIDLDKDIFN